MTSKEKSSLFRKNLIEPLTQLIFQENPAGISTTAAKAGCWVSLGQSLHHS